MRRKVAALGLGAVAVAAASSFACRQIVDFREQPPPTQPSVQAVADGGAACGVGYGTSGCASCVAAHCCQASSACAADPACAPYAACVGACAGDPTCRAQCVLDARPGKSNEGPALSACLVSQCDTECGLPCGGLTSALVYGGVPPDAAAGCQSCIAVNGCDVARACGASADCDAVRLCSSFCATRDCFEACDTANHAGTALVVALGKVTAGPCNGACARGADWSCVGRVGWPKPRSDTVKMTIQVKDFETGSIFHGVDVKVCETHGRELRQPEGAGVDRSERDRHARVLEPRRLEGPRTGWIRSADVR